MKLVRIIAAIITCPLWLLGGLLLILAFTPFLLMGLVLAVIEFVLSGEWKFDAIMMGEN